MEAMRKHAARVTDQQLLEAEKGLIRLLHAKRFPREWIERHAPEAMAQARTDFAARLAADREDDTVNLLVVIGYRRAVKLLDSQQSGPRTTSVETLFHLADESTPTPEEEAIDHDRQERVVKAMSHLPERERKLMALVYFEEMSIREAGRRLGWGKSAVDRHHRSALEKLEAQLDRSLLSPEIAIPAFICAQHGVSPAVRYWVQGAWETIFEGAMLGSGRLGPLAETGSAAATSGAGRTAAGVCGVAVAACLAGAATGVVGPGVGAVGAGTEAPPRTADPPAGTQAADELPRDSLTTRPGGSGSASKESTDRMRGADGSRGSRREALSRPRRRPRQSPAGGSAPARTSEQVVGEFGVEGGGVDAESSPPRSSSEVVQAAPIPSDPPAAARPKVESSGGSPSGSSGGGSSSDSGSSSEFGL